MHIVNIVNDALSVRELQEVGAEINMKDTNGDLPIDIAKRNNSFELVELFSIKKLPPQNAKYP